LSTPCGIFTSSVADFAWRPEPWQAALRENVMAHRLDDAITPTRGGRIGYAKLGLGDPGFVRTLDSWFAGSANGGDAFRIAAPPTFAPLRLGEASFPNRVALAPASEGRSPHGIPGEAQAQRLLRAAEAGAGLVLTEPVAVAADGRNTDECPTIEGEEHAEAWPEVATGAKARGHGPEIQTGAANGAEMGVWNLLQQPQREANLALALDEYLRFGLEAAALFVN